MALTRPHARPSKARSLPWLAILALILAALVPLATFGSHAEGTHSGRAIAVQADASVADAVVVDITACDTGPLPEAGQPTQDCEVLNAAVIDDPVALTASVLRGVSTGEGDTSESTATISDLDLAFGGTAVTPALLAVTATVLESKAMATCTAEGVELEGDTTITDLAIEVLGTAVDVELDPDGTFTTTVGTITLTVVADDRQRNIEPSDGGEYGELTVSALSITLTDTATDTTIELVFSEAHADIFCSAQDQPTDAPTSAPTDAPTSAPTDAPTSAPTDAPTSAPTDAPTSAPTDAPTSAPTDAPTSAPTDAPTSAPTDAPTSAPPTLLPDTASAMAATPSSGDQSSLLLVLLLAAIVGASLVVRSLRRNHPRNG